MRTPHGIDFDAPLEVLTSRQVQQIDNALSAVGPFAEVWLLKKEGKLHFIKKLDSENAIRARTL